MKLWIVDYVDDEGANQWYTVVAETEASAKIRFILALRDQYGYDDNDELTIDIVDLHPIEEVDGHKVTVV